MQHGADRVRHPRGVQRLSTTVVGLVGSPAPSRLRALATALGQGTNVRAVLPEPDTDALDRAVAAWRAATAAHVPYLVHDADPLAEVAAAWIDRWDGTGSDGVGDHGRLEVTVQAVLRRWRARSLDLPDYYLVVAPDGLPETARHWYLGVLADAAPHRVAVVEDDDAAMVAALRRLRAGRWWPDLDRMLAELDRRMPDRFVSGAATGTDLV